MKTTTISTSRIHFHLPIDTASSHKVCIKYIDVQGFTTYPSFFSCSKLWPPGWWCRHCVPDGKEIASLCHSSPCATRNGSTVSSSRSLSATLQWGKANQNKHCLCIRSSWSAQVVSANPLWHCSTCTVISSKSTIPQKQIVGILAPLCYYIYFFFFFRVIYYGFCFSLQKEGRIGWARMSNRYFGYCWSGRVRCSKFITFAALRIWN